MRNQTNDAAHRLLISTPRYVLHLDLGTKAVDIVEEGRREYYGVSWPSDGSELVMAHSVFENYQAHSLMDLIHSEVGILSIGGRTTDPCLAFPHQILCQGDDAVLVTNTGRNALARFRRDDLSMRNRRYDAAMWDSLGEGQLPGGHFNSLYQRGDTVYMLAHNNRRPSYVLEIDAHTLDLKGKVQSNRYTGLHNIWVTDEGRYLSCHSIAGAIVDIKTDELVFSSSSTSFTRGVASDGELLFVGGSTRGNRETRHTSETGLWIIDPRTWKALDYLPVGNYGNVKEVRLINKPDLCHHGHLLDPAAIAHRKPAGTAGGETKVLRAWSGGLDPGRWHPLFGCVHTDEQGRFQSFPGQLSVATLSGSECTDVRVDATLHLVDGAEGHLSLLTRQAGLEPGGHCYAALVEGGPQPQIGLWKVQDGAWVSLATAAVPAAAGRRFALTFETAGGRQNVSVDGEPLLSTADDGVRASGAVGLRILGQGVRASGLGWQTSCSRKAAA